MIAAKIPINLIMCHEYSTLRALARQLSRNHSTDVGSVSDFYEIHGRGLTNGLCAFFASAGLFWSHVITDC